MAGEPADVGVPAVGGDGGDLQDVAVGEVAAVVPGPDGAGVAAGHDQVPGAGLLALGQADARARGDEAVADQVVAGAAGQFAGLVFGAGHQQGVLAVEVVGEPAAVGLFGGLFGGAAAQPTVFFVVGEHGDVPGAQPQGGVAFPGWVNRCGSASWT